jgi:hypothetical protein
MPLRADPAGQAASKRSSAAPLILLGGKPVQHKGFNAAEAHCRGPANPARSRHVQKKLNRVDP